MRRTILPLVMVIAMTAITVITASCTHPTGTLHTPMATPLPFLHVEHPSSVPGDSGSLPYLADPAGRRVILRGVAASGFEDQDFRGATGSVPHFPVDLSAYRGRCPVNDLQAPDPPLCEVAGASTTASTAASSANDFAQMHALGFTLVRLTINWSELEPRPGSYSPAFLDRIAEVVRWAGAQGIYVILDMHQDQYSRFLNAAPARRAAPPGCTPSNGQDGAPAWAVLAAGEPSCSMLGQNELNPAMAAAFQSFWDDASSDTDGPQIPQGAAPGRGLQDHYIGALATLARRFENNSNVLGYELMNEPLPGAPPGSALPVTNLYNFSDGQLYPFYRRAVEALTGVRDSLPTCPAEDPSGIGSSTAAGPAAHCAYPPLAHVSHQEILVEPTGYANVADFAPQRTSPFTSYSNLVFAPHVYTHVFTADTLPGSVGTYPPSYLFADSTAVAEASAMHAALLVTEYGDAPADDPRILSGITSAYERTLSGSVFWTWKENCGTSRASACSNGWGVYRPPAGPGDQNGDLNPSRVEYLDRAWPRATSGDLLSYAYDAPSGSFSLDALSATRVPRGSSARATVVYLPPAARGALRVNGAAILDHVQELAGGGRLVFLDPTGSGSYRLREGSPPPAAATPLVPEDELAARATFDSWVGEQTSPIVAALETVLLGPPGADPNTESPPGSGSEGSVPPGA